MNEPIQYTAEELAAAGLPPTPTGKPVQQKTEAGENPPSPPPTTAAPESSRKRDTVEVKAGNEIRPLIPQSMDEAYRFAKMLAMTYNLAEAYYKLPKAELTEGRKVDIIELATVRAVHAIQLGAEVGLPPGQAVQSILMLNGVGTIWGDAQLALVQKSGLMVHFKEYTEGEMWLEYKKDSPQNSIPDRDYAWVIEVKRDGDKDITIKKFTIHDAIHANLWGKKTWATHPGRMGMYKVRAFTLRDKFADVLKGLTHSVEEFEGEMLDVTPNGNKIVPHDSAQQLNKLLEHAPAPAVDTLLTPEKKKVKAHVEEK